MKKIELFTNLVNLAAADNQFDETEIRFLVNRANQWDIPNEEVETALAGISAGGVQITIPDSEADRILLLKEMIRLMAVDGRLADEERQLCARTSSRMDITSQQFREIVDQVIHER